MVLSTETHNWSARSSGRVASALSHRVISPTLRKRSLGLFFCLCFYFLILKLRTRDQSAQSQMEHLYHTPSTQGPGVIVEEVMKSLEGPEAGDD